jgi:tRNA pseudouridine32 synthase / 23S rRNA pseudouridine746 synthase
MADPLGRSPTPCPQHNKIDIKRTRISTFDKVAIHCLYTRFPLAQPRPNFLMPAPPSDPAGDLSQLQPLTDFGYAAIPTTSPITDWYEGDCIQTGNRLRLPRTAFSEAIARGLMHQLSADPIAAQESKMYGVLLVETAAGVPGVLKACSGLQSPDRLEQGWVPPIPGRNQVRQTEAEALKSLAALKQTLITLQNIPERSEYATRSAEFTARLQHLTEHHHRRQQDRHQQRQQDLATLTGTDLAAAIAALDDASRRDGIERRHLKRQRDALLQPLQQVIAAADRRIQALKQQRKQVSRQLQAQMHAHYQLTNFAGRSLPLQALSGSLPTGTGECCAPKLLHYAATHQLKPLALAEFWWGETTPDKLPGTFYGACESRCQPLMGFLLGGLDLPPTAIDSPQSLPSPAPPLARYWAAQLPILYEDEWLIVIHKPAGLLSVPGRSHDRQDSVLSRIQQEERVFAVHRLDQDTSGLLLLARDGETQRRLSRQFQQRQVHKVYEAVVAGRIEKPAGVIDLPLWGDPDDRPYQKVDHQRGKASVTQFQVMVQASDHTRMEFVPLTGRTHQLRVHAAHPAGLGVPIVGDRLYGDRGTRGRLYLHARELRLTHPHQEQPLTLRVETPF